MGWQPETQPKGKPPVEKTKGAETMQRLIDAEALKKRIIAPRANGKDLITELIDSMPTVDAVPIEFIQKRIDQLKEMNGLIFEYESWELERLVRKWREENATAD